MFTVPVPIVSVSPFGFVIFIVLPVLFCISALTEVLLEVLMVLFSEPFSKTSFALAIKSMLSLTDVFIMELAAPSETNKFTGSIVPEFPIIKRSVGVSILIVLIVLLSNSSILSSGFFCISVFSL